MSYSSRSSSKDWISHGSKHGSVSEAESSPGWSGRRPSFYRRFSSDITFVPEENSIALMETPQSIPEENPLFTGFAFPPRNQSISQETRPLMSKRSISHPIRNTIMHRKMSSADGPYLPSSERYFKSRRIGTTKPDKPWLQKPDPRQKWASLFPFFGLLCGIILAGILVWNGLEAVPSHEYCLVLNDSFTGPELNSGVWTKEAQVDGYGNGQFEETTVGEENVFIRDGALWIKPTLQDISLIEQTGSTIDLQADGTCTGDQRFQCYTMTNLTNSTIVNPVKSGRINTKKSAMIQYGRVEVIAKMPHGDWLWPAIWMLPQNETYGIWPRSGEIDIAESRGNNQTYSIGGNNIISSALHWGPDQQNDAWWRTYGRKTALRGSYSSQFHTYGLEWSEKYLFTYIDSKLNQVLYATFSKPFWQRGHFPFVDANGTAYVNAWAQTGLISTPFDQPFYLILNVAVGGHNGWFEDGKYEKPWVNHCPTERNDFWKAKDSWYPTWEKDGQMVVKSVKMWQQKGYRGC